MGYLPDGRHVVVSRRGDKIHSVVQTYTVATKTTELYGGEVTEEVPTWVWPPIVDSHVHLAVSPVGEQLAAHGVGAVVDLGAPESTLRAAAPLTIIASGPMITQPNGYPLDSWGANGYGIGCSERTCVIAAIDRLAAAGAGVIKLPLDRGGMVAELVAPAVDHAHAKGLKVAVHALTNEAALCAMRASTTPRSQPR